MAERQLIPFNQEQWSTYWRAMEEAKEFRAANPSDPRGYITTFPTSAPPRHASGPSTIHTVGEMIEQSRHLYRIAYNDPRRPDFSYTPTTEADFKKAFATQSVRVGAALGRSPAQMKDLVRSIYAFETGGWGTHFTTSSMPKSMVNAGELTEAAKKHRPISTAVGYVQLMYLDVARNLDRHGGPNGMISAELRARAKAEPARVNELNAKAELLERMTPLLQKELADMAASNPARFTGVAKPGGKDPREELYYEFAKSDEPTKIMVDGKPLSRKNLMAGIHPLTIDKDVGPLLQAAEVSNLMARAKEKGLDKLLAAKAQELGRNLTGEKLYPMAIELMNFMGADNAEDALRTGHGNLPTTNYYREDGYSRNRLAQGKSVNDLIRTIYDEMNGAAGDPAQSPGQRSFGEAFAAVPTSATSSPLAPRAPVANNSVNNEGPVHAQLQKMAAPPPPPTMANSTANVTANTALDQPKKIKTILYAPAPTN
jgi:hypothetical protein